MAEAAGHGVLAPRARHRPQDEGPAQARGAGAGRPAPPALFLRDPRSGGALERRPVPGAGRPGEATPAALWRDPAADFAWPEIDGIVFVNASHATVAARASAALARGEIDVARALLLCVVDRHAPRAPGFDRALAVSAAGAAGADPRDLMEMLEFGPVADYFALRASAPTFHSGLELLRLAVRRRHSVIEIACGVGHFLYWLRRAGVGCMGVDAVWSKLWLARRFLLDGDTPLVCADIEGGAHFPLAAAAQPDAASAAWPRRTETPVRTDTSVFCHDAFYFFSDKARALDRFRALRAGAEGRVLIGHTHLADRDHGAVAGHPLSLARYRDLMQPSTACFDDSALARAATGAGTAPGALDGTDPRAVEAIALMEPGDPLASPELPRGWPDAELLTLAPCVRRDARSASTRARWPTPAFASEYREAAYLEGRSVGPADFPAPAAVLGAAPAGDLQALGAPPAFVRLGVRPVRWAVLGAGWIGRDYMIPAFAGSPWARLTAVVDSDRAALERAAACCGDPRTVCTDDLQAVIDAGEIDAVYVATPNHVHVEHARRALAAGLHVLCEKPMSTTVEDAREMVRCAERAGVGLAVAFDQRFHAAHAAIRAVIAAGRLGRITQIRSHYACWVPARWRPGQTAAPGRPLAHGADEAGDVANWRIDRGVAGGGAGIDLLPHGVDLVSYLADSEVVHVDARVQGQVHDYARAAGGVDDGAVALLALENGVIATLHTAYSCPEHLPRRQLEIFGERGRIHALDTMGQDGGGRVDWTIDGVESRTEYSERVVPGPFARQLDVISRCWAVGEELPFDVRRDARHHRLLLEALARAERRASAEGNEP